VTTRSRNEQRLRKAGVIKKNVRLQRPYRAVIEGLTPDEVDVIIAVYARLDEAERVTGLGPKPRDEMVRIMMPP
jgi:hypothetical protein